MDETQSTFPTCAFNPPPDFVIWILVRCSLYVKKLAYVCTALRLFPCLRVEGFIYVPRLICPLITKHPPSLLYEGHGCMEKGQHTYLFDNFLYLLCTCEYRSTNLFDFETMANKNLS
jgi:hypothetical protein